MAVVVGNVLPPHGVQISKEKSSTAMKKGGKERMGNIIGNGNNNDASSSSSTAGGAVQRKKKRKRINATSSSTPAGGTVQRKKKRRKLLNNVEQEKRGAPYRSQPASGTMIRILRAARQRLYLVTGTDNSTSENRRMDFQVLGFYRKFVQC